MISMRAILYNAPMSKRNQKALLVLLIAIIGAFTSTKVTPPTTPAATNVAAAISATEWYPVKKIVDGDTIDISVGEKSVRLRLIGLDTPETVDPRKPVQCFGKDASDQAKKVLQGQSVRIETDDSQGTYDKYGRLLAYVYVPLNSKPEGLLFNEYMITEGYGHEYTYDLPYKYQKEFKAAEKTARESDKGLWAPDACDGKTNQKAS